MREHQHLTAEILNAYEREEVSDAQLVRLLVERGNCASCLAALARWRQPFRGRLGGRSLLARVLHQSVPAAPDEERNAQRDFRALLELPREEREPKIRRGLKRYRSATLARLLLEASDEHRAADGHKAHHLATLAEKVIRQTPHSARTEDMRVLCLVHKAAAMKALGELKAAERTFNSARALLNGLLAPSLRVQADLDQIEGSYRKDRRQLRRSQEMLRRAVSTYELLAEPVWAARTRLVLGAAQFYSGAIESALKTTAAALAFLTPESHLRLFLVGRYNTSLYLTESGQAEVAAARFKTDLPLYRDARPRWPNLDLHFHWLAGKIQRGLGQFRVAEDHLLRARDGFAEHGTSYDAILVCLDLALVYAAQKRHEELFDLADLMVSGFAAQGLHDESLAAVSLAAEAARERRLTEKVVRKVSHFLQFSRHDPGLKWSNVRDLGPSFTE